MSSRYHRPRLRSLREHWRRDPGLWCVVVAVVAVIALYVPTLGRGLVNFDDSWLIRDNWIVQEHSWSSVWTILFDLHSPNRLTLSPEYLPIRDLSVLLDFAIWGDWFGGFHLTNLVLYLGAVVLWFGVLTGFGMDRRVAGLAILLWALHPAHAESVAWLSERKGLLAIFFAGACGLGYTRFRAGRSARWLVLAALCAVLAVWSKGTAAFAVATLAGLDVVFPGHVAKNRRWIGLAVIAVVAAAAFTPVMMLAASSHVVGTDVVAPAGRFTMVFGVLGFYARLGLITLRNSVSYPISIEGPTVVDIILGAMVLGMLLWAAASPRRWRFASPPPLRAAAVIFLVGWLPVSHLILPLQMVFVADRYLLFPTLGIAVAAAFGMLSIRSSRARTALCVAVVVTCALRTLDAQSTWRTDLTLWQRAVETNPSDGEAWSMYAEAAMESDTPELAFDILHQGLRHSRSPRLLLRKALFVRQTSTPAAALRAMRDAAEAGEPKAMMNLALLLLDAGDVPEAMTWARRAAALLPTFAPVRRTLGKVALAANEPALALVEFEAAYAHEPKNHDNVFNLGLVLLTLHRDAEARPYLEACLADPALADAARALLGRMPH